MTGAVASRFQFGDRLRVSQTKVLPRVCHFAYATQFCVLNLLGKLSTTFFIDQEHQLPRNMSFE